MPNDFLDRLDRDLREGRISPEKYERVLNWWERKGAGSDD